MKCELNIASKIKNSSKTSRRGIQRIINNDYGAFRYTTKYPKRDNFKNFIIRNLAFSPKGKEALKELENVNYLLSPHSIDSGIIGANSFSLTTDPLKSPLLVESLKRQAQNYQRKNELLKIIETETTTNPFKMISNGFKNLVKQLQNKK